MSFVARLDSAEQVARLVECLLSPDKRSDGRAHVSIDAAGMEFSVMGRSRCTRATLTLPAARFAAFSCQDGDENEVQRGDDFEALTFAVDVQALVDCLRIFGGGDAECGMSYVQRDEVFKITLEEPGAFTACDVHVLEGLEGEDECEDNDLAASFRGSPVVAHVLATSATLRDVVQDLDESSVAAATVRLAVGPAPARVRLSANGSIGGVQIDVPRDCFVIFEPPAVKRRWSYPSAAFHQGMRALQLAEETSLRINDFGMLGVQHMIAADAGEAENVYLEFICCAEEPDAAAGDASASPEARRAPPTSPEASPAF